MFFRLFFRLSAHFRPHSSAIFHLNTPHNFFVARYQHKINDDLSKKKSPHFREKYLVKPGQRRAGQLMPDRTLILIILILFPLPSKVLCAKMYVFLLAGQFKNSKHFLCASGVFLIVNRPKNPNFSTRNSKLYQHRNLPKSSHQS